MVAKSAAKALGTLGPSLTLSQEASECIRKKMDKQMNKPLSKIYTRVEDTEFCFMK